jgi:hypothetical protein
MSILGGLGIEERWHEWNKKTCKGIIAKYITRGKRPLQTVSKTLKTYMRSGYVSREQLNDILSLVEIETVRPFRDPARLARYNELRRELGF